MTRFYFVLYFLLIVFCSCSHTYYIVRHAEKATAETHATSDVPLTQEGKQRAEALKDVLKNKKIAYIFSTNTIRTRSTAEPTANYFNLPIELYSAGSDSTFANLLRSKKKNTLVVGHSNTVDGIVNKLCHDIMIPGDLPETQYDNLFIVKKKGKKISFTRRKYGKPSG